MFGLFALDFGIVVTGVYLVTVPVTLSPVVAILVGVVLGVIALSLCFIEGNTVQELIVSSSILLVLLLILCPVVSRARANAAKRQKLEQRAATGTSQIVSQKRIC